MISVRRRAERQLGHLDGDDFASELDARWRHRLASRNLFVNDLFLTIVRRPLQGKAGIGDRLRGWLSRKTAMPRPWIATAAP